MPKTPDRRPGVEDQEGTIYESTVAATVAGEVRYDGTSFSLRDATGVFDPRTGGAPADPFLPRVLSADLTVPGDKTALGHDVLVEDGVEILVLDGGELLCI